jgi:hypothetical protein
MVKKGDKLVRLEDYKDKITAFKIYIVEIVHENITKGYANAYITDDKGNKTVISLDSKGNIKPAIWKHAHEVEMPSKILEVW